MSQTHATTVPVELNDVAAALTAGMPEVRERLEALVRIPSISFPGHDPEQVRASASETASSLGWAGLENVELLEIEGAHPYVYADWLHAGDGAPTVLLYAHHDVQPVGTPDRWTSEPFEPTERDGRLFARGAADDKAGVAVHIGAVRAWLTTRGALPVNVKVIIEGEEEIGSPHLGEFLEAYTTKLRADVIVLTDLPNWKVGWPALTYSLRGMGELIVTLEALEAPIHNGMFGGPVPDVVSAMLKILAGLNDAQGKPAVDGIFDDVRPVSASERAMIDALGFEPEALRDEARMVDGAEFVGDPDLHPLQRMWQQPTITVIGLDMPSVTNASNQLLGSVRAKLNFRLAPGQSSARVQKLVADHLRAAVPWGLKITVEPGAANDAWSTEPTGPAFDAALAAMAAGYGHEAALIGGGGSIPFVQPFSDAFDGAPCLLTGIEDPHTNAHGEDESLHLGDFHRATLTEALLFAELAARADELKR